MILLACPKIISPAFLVNSIMPEVLTLYIGVHMRAIIMNERQPPSPKPSAPPQNPPIHKLHSMNQDTFLIDQLQAGIDDEILSPGKCDGGASE